MRKPKWTVTSATNFFYFGIGSSLLLFATIGLIGVPDWITSIITALLIGAMLSIVVLPKEKSDERAGMNIHTAYTYGYISMLFALCFCSGLYLLGINIPLPNILPIVIGVSFLVIGYKFRKLERGGDA